MLGLLSRPASPGTGPAPRALVAAPSPARDRRSRWRRRAAVLVCLIVGLAAGLVFANAALPSVADAPRRVGLIDARHGTRAAAVCACSRLARAVVAVEDERFYSHGAIDPWSLARVIKGSVFGSVDPGGSTISQQLAKVLYVRDPSSLLGRLKAIGLAAKLERRYGKDTILRMYLNAVYYGHGFYGAAAASRGYFGRRVSALSWSQASLLAGLPQAPTAYDPMRHLTLARERQREVLAQLVDNGVLPRVQARAVLKAPLHLRRS